MSIIQGVASLTPTDVEVINFLFFQVPTAQVNFRDLGLGMAAISFGLIGLLMAGSAFFGELAEQAKRTWLPTTIQGLILIGITSFIMGTLTAGINN